MNVSTHAAAMTATMNKRCQKLREGSVTLQKSLDLQG
jgi:hypothetical protein